MVVDSKLVSKKHCAIKYNETTRAVRVVDFSSNGSLLNNVVLKGEERPLENGDEIVLARNKGEKIGFYFVQTHPKLVTLTPTKPIVSTLSNQPTAVFANPPVERLQTRSGSRKESTTSTTTNINKDNNDNNNNNNQTHASNTNNNNNTAAATNDDLSDKGKDSSEDGAQPPAAKKARLDDDAQRTAYEDNMCCGVCYDFMYRCVSVLPCMHSFCGACLSRWFKAGHTSCPTCRREGERVTRNHQLTNIVESYLQANPDKKRPPEEYAEMDKVNTFTEDELRVKPPARNGHDDDDNDDYDSYGSDYGDDDDDDDDGQGNRAVCRECAAPGADGFQCAPAGPNNVPPATPHLWCCACAVAMADRGQVAQPIATQPGDLSIHFDNAAVARPQRCAVCLGPHCNLYHGACPSQNRMLRVKDHQVRGVPPSALCNNAFERGVLSDYLAGRGRTVQQVYDAFVARLGDGSVVFHGWKPDTAVCAICIKHLVNEALYRFREAIPVDELPPHVRARSNCWYGKGCRTQTHNAAHAAKLNHICEAKKK